MNLPTPEECRAGKPNALGWFQPIENGAMFNGLYLDAAVNRFHAPGGNGIRVDSHLYSGYTVPPNYDSLIGKVISWADDRHGALMRMRNALDEIVVEGIRTNIPLHQQLVRDEAFHRGGVSIHYLEKKLQK